MQNDVLKWMTESHPERGQVRKPFLCARDHVGVGWCERCGSRSSSSARVAPTISSRMDR